MKEITNGLWKKIIVFFGFDGDDRGKDARVQGKNRKEQVVNVKQKRDIQILVLEPVSFEEVRKIVDHLLNQRPIVLNLDKTDKAQAKRIIDFVSGATYALQGNMQKIGDGIFLFAPHAVEISGQELKGNDFWKEDWRKKHE